MSRAVWDASAVLFVLFCEPGWEEWAPSLPESVVSTVNFSEVMTKIMALGGVPVATREVLDALPIEIHSFTSDLAYLAAKLRKPTKSVRYPRSSGSSPGGAERHTRLGASGIRA